MKIRNIDLVKMTNDKSFESIKYITIQGVTIHNISFNNSKNTVTKTREKFIKSVEGR